MKFFLFLFFLLILASCESAKQSKSIENNKKQKNIIMKITTGSND